MSWNQRLHALLGALHFSETAVSAGGFNFPISPFVSDPKLIRPCSDSGPQSESPTPNLSICSGAGFKGGRDVRQEISFLPSEI